MLPDSGGNTALFVCPALRSPSRWTNFMFFNPSYGYNAFGTRKLVFGDNSYRSLGLDGDWHEESVSIGTSPWGFGGGRGSGTRHVFSALSSSRVLAPSDMMAIGDYPEVRVSEERQDGDIEGALEDQEDYISDRHEGGGNVVFCDGHVEFDSQTNWMRAADGPRQRWNNDDQSHPETWY